MPASSNDMDTRGCYEKYCVPIAHTVPPAVRSEFLESRLYVESVLGFSEHHGYSPRLSFPVAGLWAPDSAAPGAHD